MIKNITILGAGESGFGAAMLANQKGHNVFVSDSGNIREDIKSIFLENSIKFEEKNHSFGKIEFSDLVIKSPGISNSSEIISKIRSIDIPIISEIEFASSYSNSFKICITGTNGKTTTTKLIHHILNKSGLDVGLAGNIGDSFSKMLLSGDKDIYVIEISSFQLDDIKKFKPNISIITNIIEDHLDRYENDFSKYVDAKMKIIKNQDESDYLIYNSDDKALMEVLKNKKLPVNKISIGIENNHQNRVFIDNNIFSNKKKTIMINTEEFALKGRHNLLNAMAAITVSDLLKIDNKIIRESLLTFSGLPHRLENFLKIQGVNYINDSKATNVNAAYYALDSMKSPTVWIAGGVDKGNDYSELLPIVREKVKAIICLGIDNAKIIETFKPVIEIIVETESITEAVKVANKIAEKKDNVLLSPACASFDLFDSYEDRGDQFKKAVRNL
ncbi:MAG: UDP-N-acetylmuramoyl-L-alanine--D-glutamate ligase [Cryomorphaceae bacterium]|jgi:UDP-N-acetylmuramoylalanine--D-glutamate ligase|nr:UDP-N-acetylmuramoyl-L-alanine--D-glutamate ligase [Cryomorphaceae bacterium]MBT3503297.1 UDP-N-acetylmuramoyl-L-alanine--D-glutamate ligase [Cryomorphaceae bacterium]MBT3689681.1 UDP-N-acetylmuramoyl-L-alanine--D-glutamate ligase [Cryomorphaceae bacterium]MBT4221760.1 UDP-N-acetylmuramoyl-L-alanine--D-glutamate ligase [Cryomorphaceae bacterium]MBT4293227.1 UDP-N-acetylmuramoyl-L-alanine--D-glutamate ligase [Cryomorphaceae bacterium]|tara:strand:+ start:396 stop:1727 length:1332 start_codon:yes stop_codon:yes gene_type:complete